MKIEREQLLKELESVTPGLSNREIIEQSKCFVFKNKVVATYNDEVACFQDSCLNIEGAVQSDKFLALLRKLSETTIDVDVEKSELKIRGKSKRIGIPLEKEVVLPIDSIKRPKKWIPLPADFLEAVTLVRDCVGKDETQFHLTCIHLHPEWIEACDNYQAARYVMTTGIEKSILIRKDSLKHVTSLGMTEFGVTKSWIHFKNPNGLILSCRLYVEEYPDLTDILSVKGIKISLPKGLEQAVDRAGIFSATDADENHVLVDLSPGKVEIKGQSISGRYSETNKKIDYDKDPMTFTIAPNLLISILSKYNKCTLSRKQQRLKAGMGKFTYVTVLGSTEKNNSENKETEEE